MRDVNSSKPPLPFFSWLEQLAKSVTARFTAGATD
jgi:hypothetical protein